MKVSAKPLKIGNIEVEKIIEHAIYNCIKCNEFLSNLVIHYKQDRCKHKFEKIEEGTKFCRKCLKAEKK